MGGSGRSSSFERMQTRNVDADIEIGQTTNALTATPSPFYRAPIISNGQFATAVSHQR